MIDCQSGLRRLVIASIEPVRRRYHRWQRHDVVVWDNWRTTHSAEGTPVDATRKLYRSGIGSSYACAERYA
jgi:taurine dioxygenase